MTEKPKTHAGDLAHLPDALLPLTADKRWVVWPWELRVNKGGKEKWTKPPRQASDPHYNARSNDPSTWGTYDDALAAVQRGDADGVGYMLLGAAVGAVDLDHVYDGDGLIRWADQLCAEAAGSYQETTVSGAGRRIIGRTSGPETHRKFTFNRKTGAGIELYRDTARYITVSGLEIGHCPTLPPLDSLIDTLLARHAYGATPDALDFNNAGPQHAADYDALIQHGAREGERSEKFQQVVWHLAGQGWTAEQIADELARHPNGIGAKYADRLLAEVTRSYEKWRSHKRNAATGIGTAAAGAWPQICIVAGELPRIVNEAEDALVGLGRDIFQRGSQLVRPVLSQFRTAHDRDAIGWRLVPVTRPHLTESLTRAARFLKYDSRTKAFVPCDVPDKIAETYLAREGAWKLPVLTGIVNSPFLRTDGSLCEVPGYDAASGLLFKADGQAFPAIAAEPSKAEAAAALAEIERLIETFPFVGGTDCAVALSAILTTLDRRSMSTAPLHAFTAPAAGTGKSLLVDITAMLATGRPMPVISQGRNEEELEKRLGAALLAGDVAISLDNCDHVLQSALLCQALTQCQLNIRLLGFSQNIETLVNATIFATGNNLTISGDLCRRSLICAMDAHVERPELRTFADNIVDTVRMERGRLVAAALTVLRAWHVSGERISIPPFGGFETWSHRVRSPLIWLGRDDPCATVAKVREDDPKRTALLAVLLQWREAIGLRAQKTVREIIAIAITYPDFMAALLNVAANKSATVVSNDRLGWWLKHNESKIANGLSLVRAGNTHGYPLWQLIET